VAKSRRSPRSAPAAVVIGTTERHGAATLARQRGSSASPVVFGFVSGIAIERMRFDRERQAVLGRLEARVQRVHAHRMALEHGAGPPPAAARSGPTAAR
jgi:hypothetical protein